MFKGMKSIKFSAFLERSENINSARFKSKGYEEREIERNNKNMITTMNNEIVELNYVCIID